VDDPSDYAAEWKKRYDELLGHGVPEERAKQLASELAAAAVLTAARARGDLPPEVRAMAPAKPARVLRMAKFDGYGLIVMGIPSVIIACFSSSVVGIAIGAVVTGCGFLELDGFRRFTGGLPGARMRLMGSQLSLIALAWAYAGWSVLHPDPLSPEVSDLLKASGDNPSDVMALVDRLRWMVAAAICGVSLLYQGGLSYYYWSKTRARG